MDIDKIKLLFLKLITLASETTKPYAYKRILRLMVIDNKQMFLRIKGDKTGEIQKINFDTFGQLSLHWKVENDMFKCRVVIKSDNLRKFRNKANLLIKTQKALLE